ncbi:MAG: hypothetical protein NC818_03930 [Candidatus Omnitrophica bacterium]|nr:hypothetical protein [Candidatus Omnitrophota bacterium]
MILAISIILFLIIAWKFIIILGETCSTLFKFIKVKTPLEKKRLKRLLLIRTCFLLPCEFLTLFVTSIFAFIVFHWFSSSLLAISLVSILFKEIFSEIPYLLVSTFLYFFRKPLYLKDDPFIQETEIIPANFFSALYIPQKAKSNAEVYACITQGLRALRNNLNPKSHLAFIYHSDTEEESLVEEEIRLILDAKKELGSKVFLFARNQEAYNPMFLKKPGGYMSDYQILTTGVWHPLNYVSHSFDARRQKIVCLDGEIQEHIPFYSLGKKDEFQYFLHYKGNFFLREKLNLKKYPPQEEIYEDIKFLSESYLIDKTNSEKYYLISQGAIFSPQGELLFNAKQWKIDSEGRIEFLESRDKNFEGKNYAFIFVQIVYTNEGKKLILDSVSNLIDASNGKIWARAGEYRIDFSYDLYKLKDKKFHFVKKDITIEKKLIKGVDYRRLAFDRLLNISWLSIKNLVKEKIISFSQADEFMKNGIIGNIYNLHIGKKGIEKEYFIEDTLIKLKERVFGGYLVQEGRGFRLDKEGNLFFEDNLIEPKENIKETFLHRENDLVYLMYREKEEDFFVRLTETNEKVIANPKDKYIYIHNSWINKIKITDSGFVVNEKDGFYLDNEGNIWYIGDVFEKGIAKPLLIAKKDKIKELHKEEIALDYTNYALIKTTLLAEAGGWYKDKENNIRIRKILSLKDYVYFDEKLNALVINPLDGDYLIYPSGSYTVGDVYLWQKESTDDVVVKEKDVLIKNGNLIKEELLAKKEDYIFNKDGEIVLKNGEKLPYGIHLRFKDAQILRDENGNFIPADCGIKIINQTDADDEFQPQTLSYLNSKLIHNLHEEDPYLMLQPEICFANQGQSTFARFHSWAQQMYRFSARAIFSLYGESSAYGKMTKLVDAYVKNILFKEAIPPLARTHDHWEAMHLKTALVYSYPYLKSKNLIENIPPNYISFLKRLEGWLGGDLLLLEYETYFGVFIDFFRMVFSLLKINFSEFKFWLGHIYVRIKYLKEKNEAPSYLAKILRIWLIKRLAFSPLYYCIWLMLIGTISLVIPGILTIKSPAIAWHIFWSVLIILIFLPKAVVPLLERLILFEKKKEKLLIFLLLLLISFYIYKLGNNAFPGNWGKFSAFIISLYVLRRIIIYIMKSIFSLYPGLINRLVSIVIISTIGFFAWLYAPFLLNWMENITSANWVFLFLFQSFPSLAGFLFPLILLLEIVPSQRTVLDILKRGFIETIYSSSILLMNVVHIPFIVISKIWFIIFNPNTSIPWFTTPFVEKILGKKTSLFEVYLRLIATPILSLTFAVIPVFSGLADPSLIFYGWPVFIWSWIIGPMLAWLSGNYGESPSFSSLEFLGMRDRIKLLKKELSNKNKPLEREQIIENILEYNLEINHTLGPRELLRIFLSFLTEMDWEKFPAKNLLEKLTHKEILPENLREYNWETLNELSRARILLKLYKNKKYRIYLPQDKEIKFIKALTALINLMGPKKLGFPPWEELSFNQQKKLIKKIIKRYKISIAEEREIRKLLQFFENSELKKLYKKIMSLRNLSEVIDLVAPEYFYLRKALSEIQNIPYAKLSLYQKDVFLNLLTTRYNLRQKIYTKIIKSSLNLISSPASLVE